MPSASAVHQLLSPPATCLYTVITPSVAPCESADWCWGCDMFGIVNILICTLTIRRGQRGCPRVCVSVHGRWNVTTVYRSHTECATPSSVTGIYSTV